MAALELRFVEQWPSPVLTVESPGAEEVKYGFEGGRAIKIDGTYHLFTSEMVGDPFWVKMRLAHWTSSTGLDWHRESTVFESSGDYSGRDPRAALWSPMPVFDERTGRWNLFYVAYRAQPSTETQWLDNHAGAIWRATSASPGYGGIAGPYEDVGVVLSPGSASDSWEGLQGVASFFPYRAGAEWYALYGSARSEEQPMKAWQVGLAKAADLGGPWWRCSSLNPLSIEPVFIENPIVHQLPDGTYLAVYDTHEPESIGYAYSTDAMNWSPGRALVVQPNGKGAWADDLRTPLGLVPEPDGTFTVFYSGYHRHSDRESRTVDSGWWKASVSSIGFARVEVRTPP